MGLVLASTLQDCDVSRGSIGGGKVRYIYTKLSDKLARDFNDASNRRIGPTSSWLEKDCSKIDCLALQYRGINFFACDLRCRWLGEHESENRLTAEQGGPAWLECMPQLNIAKTETV